MIPQELVDCNQWVCWKVVERDGKKTKMPIQVNGDPASSTDPKTWNSFAKCIDAAYQYAGVGFVFTKDDLYIGIDLDGCRNVMTGEISAWAQVIINQMKTYCEVSPSGTGVKMFGTSSKVWTGKNKKNLNVAKVCDKAPGIEVYDRGRYFAVTGGQLGDDPIRCVDDVLEWFQKEYSLQQETVAAPAGIKQSSSVSERAAAYVAKMEPAVSGQGGHNAAFKVACALVKGFELNEAEAYSVFVSVYNPRCQPQWSEREILHKLRSAAKQPGSSGFLRDALPEQWHKTHLPSNYKEHPMPPEKPEVKVLYTSVLDAGLSYLEALKTGEKPLIKTGIPHLDWSIGGGIADGEMVIVAARPSHGKSALAMQMAHEMTGRGVPVGIISEEMSAMQLGKRAAKYAIELGEDSWKENLATARHQFKDYFENREKAYIVESCGHVSKACEAIRQLKEKEGIKVAFIDYMQILNAPGKDRYSQVTAASQTLRQLASEIKIPLVVLAQLSRELEREKTFVPRIQHLKESGQIEQDADVIIAAAWPYKVDQTQPKEKYLLYILKNRNRETKKYAFEVAFDPSRQKFEDGALKQHLEEFGHDF